MLRKGDIVRLLPGRETYYYHTYREGMMSGFVLTDRLGAVVESDHDTPYGHYVILYDYTMSSTWVTIPYGDLELVRRGEIWRDLT